MSKILSVLFCAATLSSVYASALTDLIQKEVGENMSVIEENYLSQDKNIKFVTLKDNGSGYKVVVITNKQENFIIPVTAFFSGNEKDRDLVNGKLADAAIYNETFKSHAAVKAAINKIPKDYIIDIKGKGKKVFYIISDPQCPHCQVELDNINKRLEKGDVKMIPIGMLGDESAKKAAEIHKKMKNVKSDSEKISILKSIYSKAHEAPKDIDTKKVQEITRSLLGPDKVQGTPYILEEDK